MIKVATSDDLYVFDTKERFNWKYLIILKVLTLASYHIISRIMLYMTYYLIHLASVNIPRQKINLFVIVNEYTNLVYINILAK